MSEITKSSSTIPPPPPSAPPPATPPLSSAPPPSPSPSPATILAASPPHEDMGATPMIPPFMPSSSQHFHDHDNDHNNDHDHDLHDNHDHELHDNHDLHDDHDHHDEHHEPVNHIHRKNLREYLFSCIPLERTEKLHVPHIWPNIPSTEAVLMWDKFKHHHLEPIMEQHKLAAAANKPSRLHPPLSIRLLALFLMCAMVLGGGMCAASVGALTSIIEKEYNISVSKLGQLYSIYSLPTMFSVFFAGYLSDRIGINICTFAYTSMVLVGAFIASVGNSFPAMMAGRFLYGLGNESLGVVQSALVSRWFAHDHQLSMSFTMAVTLSFYRISSFMSMSILPVLGHQGLGFVLWILTIVAAISVGIAGALVYIDYLYRDYLHVPTTGEPISLKDMRKFTAEFWVLSFVTMFFYAAVLTYFTLGNDFITHKWGFSFSTASLISSVIYITPAVLVPPMGYLVDHIGQRCKLMIFSSLLIIPAYLILSYTHINPVLGCFLLGAAYSILPTCLWAGVALIVNPNIVGTAFGLLASLLNTGSFIAPLVITNIQQATDSYSTAFLFNIGLAAASTVLCCVAYYLDVKKANSVMEKTSVVKKRDKKKD